ncbi:MAG: DUF1877 family protein [Microthrixaceae bacterium]
MAGRGVLFAIGDGDVAALLGADGHAEVVKYVKGTIQERWEKDFVAETDKAWYTIHMCVAGAALDESEAPESRAIFGRRTLTTEDDRTVAFTPADEVAATAAALAAIDSDTLRAQYDLIDPETYAWADLSDDDFKYTWVYFEAARSLWQKAADAGRAVIFTVDH